MTHFIQDRIQQDGLGDQIREEDLYEPGTPRGTVLDFMKNY